MARAGFRKGKTVVMYMKLTLEVGPLQLQISSRTQLHLMATDLAKKHKSNTKKETKICLIRTYKIEQLIIFPLSTAERNQKILPNYTH